ncbi:MAG: L,D-transpeptidase [Pseudomonadota bacterium]|nr:L,D-transpeptidase [Pseudomonadota bacterium]
MIPILFSPECPPPPDQAGLVVVVDKSEFVLAVFRDRVVVPGPDGPACFAVALGASPVGHKEQRGDERTPVGTFRVTNKNPASSFHLSLGLDYPQARDAEAGFGAGRIDARTRDRVVAAAAAGGMPARDTALGGDIYLHGGGAYPNSWTDGCVAIANEQIEWLYATVSKGTIVVIRE